MQYAMSPRSEKVFFARAVIPSPPNAVFHERSTVKFFFDTCRIEFLTFPDIYADGLDVSQGDCRTKVSKLHKLLNIRHVK